MHQNKIESENTNDNSVGHFGYRAQGISNKSGYHTSQKLKMKIIVQKVKEKRPKPSEPVKQAFARRFGPWRHIMTPVNFRRLYIAGPNYVSRSV